MLPFKKILCPTDLSEPSYEALRAASELALHFSSELLVLHVVQPIPMANIPPPPPAAIPMEFNSSSYYQELEEASKRSLKEAVEKWVSKGVKVEQTVLQGEAADQIIDSVDKQKIDLVIIATHGRTGWRRFAFGSVAEKVVRLAPCPVLTIQPPLPPFHS